MKHREAVDAAVEESALDQTRRYAPLIALCRTLAAQMDAAGSDPSTRLTAAYLSALKDVERAINAAPSASGSKKLAEMRDLRLRPAPTKKTTRRSA